MRLAARLRLWNYVHGSGGARDRRSNKVIKAVDRSAAAGVTVATALFTLGAASTACSRTVSGIAIVHYGGNGFAAEDPSGDGGNGLSRAVRWHCEDRVIQYGNQTVVFDARYTYPPVAPHVLPFLSGDSRDS